MVKSLPKQSLTKSASALGGLTKIEDIEPLVRFLVTDGWWITGQTIANGGYTTR
jgi:hypothetical protein